MADASRRRADSGVGSSLDPLRLHPAVSPADLRPSYARGAAASPNPAAASAPRNIAARVGAGAKTTAADEIPFPALTPEQHRFTPWVRGAHPPAQQHRNEDEDDDEEEEEEDEEAPQPFAHEWTEQPEQIALLHASQAPVRPDPPPVPLSRAASRRASLRRNSAQADAGAPSAAGATSAASANGRPPPPRGLITSLATGRVLDADGPSAFHSVTHFLLRTAALALLLICALVRVHVWGFAFLLLYFISCGLVAFKRFAGHAPAPAAPAAATDAGGQPTQTTTGPGVPEGRVLVNMPRPHLSPLSPFLVPGLLLSLLGLLAVAALQLARRFMSDSGGSTLRGSLLRQFGMHYTEPMNGPHVAVMFVPYFVAALFFSLALVYEGWKVRRDRWARQSVAERRAEENEQIAAFQHKYLDAPIRKLDVLTADPSQQRSGVFTLAQKQKHEATIRARYAVQLSAYMKKTKEARLRALKLHRGSSSWSWFECKLHNPWFHVLVFALLLLVGLLERSVLSYVYFFVWSVVITKWSMWDRVKCAQNSGEQPGAGGGAAKNGADDAAPVANGGSQQQRSAESLQIEEIEMVGETGGRRRSVEKNNCRSRSHSYGDSLRPSDARVPPPLSIPDANGNGIAPASGVDRAPGSSPSEAPLLCSSFFPRHPSRTSFPLVSSGLPLFRLYTFLWLYSAAHVLLKYVFRWLVIFDYGNDSAVPGLSDLASPERAARSRLLFFLGEWSLPRASDGAHTMWTEEAFHLGLLLALNIYLSLLLHLSRKPHVFLPLRLGIRLFASRESLEAETAARVAARKKREQRHRERAERREAKARERHQAAEARRRAKAGGGGGSDSDGLALSPLTSPSSQPFSPSSSRARTPSSALFSPASGVLSHSRAGSRSGLDGPASARPLSPRMASPDSAPAAFLRPGGAADQTASQQQEQHPDGLKSAGAVLARPLSSWPTAAAAPAEQSLATSASAPRLSAFERLATWIGRSLWLVLPSLCFALAVLYSAFPSLAFLVAMYLSCFFALATSFRLLPVLLLYTQALNHAIYVFHLPNSWWIESAERGSDYLSHLTTSTFLALLLASAAVAFLALANKFARTAVLFWERHHGFDARSLIDAQAGASPLGLLSPRLGQREKARRKQVQALKQQVQQWQREDAENAAAPASPRTHHRSHSQQQGQPHPSRVVISPPPGSASPEEAHFKIHQDAPRASASPSLGAEVVFHDDVSSPVPHAPKFPASHVAGGAAGPSASSSSSAALASSQLFPVQEHKDAQFGDEYEDARGGGAFRVSLHARQTSPPPATRGLASASPHSRNVSRSQTHSRSQQSMSQLLDFVTPGHRRMASARARNKIDAHVGFSSREEYAAAQIQAAFRGWRARVALDRMGIPIVLPEEHRLMMQVAEADARHRRQVSQDKRQHRHHHHRRAPSAAIAAASGGGAGSGGEGTGSTTKPSLLRRTLAKARRLAMTLVLVFFSYSNLLLMVLLYILGILRVDLIHAGYMLLFLGYAVSPWVRRRPGVVVTYSSAVIIATYTWSLAYMRDSGHTNNSWTDRVGLVSIEPFNRLLYPHVAILLLSGIFHRFSPEEAAQAQLHLNRIEEEKEQRAKQAAGTDSDDDADVAQQQQQAAEEDLAAAASRDAQSSYSFSPYQPYYRGVVTAGLMLCTAVTLWAGMVNSLMSDSLDPVSTLAAVVSDPSKAVVRQNDIGVSLIVTIYLLFVFALLLIHQIRPGIRAFPWDRALLLLLCIYASGIVLLQYVYQFDVLDSAMERMAEYTDGRFTAAEIGIFKTAGALYRSLLTHSIVLFVCVGQLRLLRMDIDPVSGRSISLATGKNNSSVESMLDLLESVLRRTESRLEAEALAKAERRRVKLARQRQLARRQKRKMDAFDNDDFEALCAEEDEELAPLKSTATAAGVKSDEEEFAGSSKQLFPDHPSDQPFAPKKPPSGAGIAPHAAGTSFVSRRSWRTTLLLHFVSRVGYYSLLFADWFLLQHCDKILSFTLFIVAIQHTSLMGAWYLLLAFATLLVLGYPRVKALVAMVSAQVFVLLLLLWQFPANAFDQEQDDVIFPLIGLEKQSQFGALVLQHLAVMLVASLYGTTNFWMRVHQRKGVRQDQAAELMAYQDGLRAKQLREEREAQRRRDEEEEAALAAAMGGDAAATPGLQPFQGANLALTPSVFTPTPAPATAAGSSSSGLSVAVGSPPAAAALLSAPASSTGPPTAGQPGHFRGASLQVPGATPQGPATGPAGGAAAELLPALLSTLPSPSPTPSAPGGSHAAPAIVSGAPLVLSPQQHSALVLYSHLSAREAEARYQSEHAHPSSNRDRAVQDLANMNLEILQQGNVGPSERKGRPRYDAPLAPGMQQQQGGPGLSVAEEARRLAAGELLQDRASAATRHRSASTAMQPLPPALSAEDATGELSPSDPDEDPLKHVESWMMRVPLSEHSHRLSRERRLEVARARMDRARLEEQEQAREARRAFEARRRREELRRAQNARAGVAQPGAAASAAAGGIAASSAHSPAPGSTPAVGSSAATYPASSRQHPRSPMVPANGDHPLSWPRSTGSTAPNGTAASSSSAAAPAGTSADHVATAPPFLSVSPVSYTSPQGLNDEARTFALASSSVRLNQVDPRSAPFVHNLKYHTTRTGDEDDDAVLDGSAGPQQRKSALHALHEGMDALAFNHSLRGDGSGAYTATSVSAASGSSASSASTSSWHRLVRALLGEEGLAVFLGRFIHYFGFFHLALMSLLCATFSNASTIFSLYYIIVTGLLSYVGTRTANRYWRPLVATLTIALACKYAVALANTTPDYRCESTPSGNSCSRWLIWLGKGTRLFYWDAVAWLMVVIHHSALRVYARIEAEALERRRKEREEPWELNQGSAGGVGVGADLGLDGTPLPSPGRNFTNPMEKAAFDGTAEGAVESFRLRQSPRSGDEDAEEEDVLRKQKQWPGGKDPSSPKAAAAVASALRPHSSAPAAPGFVSPSASALAMLARSGSATQGLSRSNSEQLQLVHKFSPAVQFPPFHMRGAGSKRKLLLRGKSKQSALGSPAPSSPFLVAPPTAPLDAGLESGGVPGLGFGFRPSDVAPPVAGTAAAASQADSLLYDGAPPPALSPAHSRSGAPSAAAVASSSTSHRYTALQPLSPSGFPSYRTSALAVDPVPTYITVTYTTITNQLSSYVMGNFMESVSRPRGVLGRRFGAPNPTPSVSDYAHYVLFRCAHYVALLLLLALATSYFNLLNLSYLALGLVILWEGDALLDGSRQHRWDQVYLWSFGVVALRLVYQMPVFRLTRVVTNWSTVLGLYKVNDDDCVYDSQDGFAFGVVAPADRCALTSYAGVVPDALILDILIFGVSLLMRTLLARREMVFVRQYIAQQRSVAAIRFEIISLHMEVDRLRRTRREQQDAINRLVRVEQLKQLKIAREAALQRAREASGQHELIEGWEGQGRTLGVARKGRDEDAMVRASIRNHAINQLRFAAMDVGSPPPPGLDAAQQLNAESTLSAPLVAGAGAASAPGAFAATQNAEEAEAQALRKLARKKAQAAQLDRQEFRRKGTLFSDSDEPEADEDAAMLAKTRPRAQHTGGHEVALPIDVPRGPNPVELASTSSTAPAPDSSRQRRGSRVHAHHHHHYSSDSDAEEAAAEDPDTYRALMAATEFELHLVEARMAKLRRKRVMAGLNRTDEPPLLLLKFYSLAWVQSVRSMFTSDKHNIFKEGHEDPMDPMAASTTGQPVHVDLGDGRDHVLDSVAPQPGDIDDGDEVTMEERHRDLQALRRARKIDAHAAQMDGFDDADDDSDPPTPHDDPASRARERAEKEEARKKRRAERAPAQVVTLIDPAAGATTRVTTMANAHDAPPADGSASQAAAAVAGTGGATTPPSRPLSPVPESRSPLGGKLDKERLKEKEVELHELKPWEKFNMLGTQGAAPDSTARVQTATGASVAQGERSVVLAPSATDPAAARRKGTVSFGDGGDSDEDDLDLVPEPSVVVQVWELFTRLFLNSTWFLVIFFFLLEFLVQPSLLSILYPFSLFLYGLLTYPRPPRFFWEAMIVYTSLLLLLKFLFQFPLFCVCDTIYGQSYSVCALSNAESCSLTAGETVPNSDTSIAHVVGLRKLISRGSAHDGHFMAFVGGALLDFCTLFALCFHRRYMRIHGLWLRQKDIDVRKRQHEQLMRRLVKHGLVKESVQKWQQAREEEHDAQTTLADGKKPASARNFNKQRDSVIVNRITALYPAATGGDDATVAGAPDRNNNDGSGAGPAVKRRGSDGGVSFSPLGPQSSAVSVDIRRLRAQRHLTRFNTAKRLSDYVGGAMGPDTMRPPPSDDEDPDNAERSADKGRGKLKRMESLPTISASGKAAKADAAAADGGDSKDRNNNASARRTSSFPAGQASVGATSPKKSSKGDRSGGGGGAPERTTSWKNRVSSVLARGTSKVRGVFGRSASARNVNETAEGRRLLSPRAAGSGSGAPGGKDVPDPKPIPKAHKLSRSAQIFERSRRDEERKQLRKRLAQQKEARFQRSLRHLTLAERRERLEAHRLELEAEKEREKRHEQRRALRLKRRMAEARAASGSVGGGSGVASELDPDADLDDLGKASSSKRRGQSSRWSRFQLWCRHVYRTMLDTTYKPGKDFYIYIFLIQLLQFLVLVIFYNLSDSAGSITQNYISPQFVLVIFAQFVHIVVERVVYLYRQLLLKLCLQLASMLTFFIIALYEGLATSALLNVVYVLMCIYWLLSSLQFYHGYPPSTQGQFLAKSTHWLPSTLFILYRAIPFVFELRTLLDWLCTDTVLYFGQWLKFEDIYATFFLTQVGCDNRKNDPKEAGRKQGLLPKLAIGLGLFIILVIVVWGPLFLFSSQAATNPNPVTSSQLSVSLPGFLTLYSSSQSYVVATSGSAAQQRLNDEQYAELVARHPFLDAQRQRGLQIIYPLATSSGVWGISPLARASMVQQLASAAPTDTQPLDFRFDYARSTATAAPNTYFNWRYTLNSVQMRTLARILNGTNVLAPDPAVVANNTLPFSSSSTGADGTDIPDQILRRRRRRLLQVTDSSSSTGIDSGSSGGAESSSTGGGGVVVPTTSSANRTTSLFLPSCFPAFFFMSSIDAAGPVEALSTDSAAGLNNCLLTLVTSGDQFGVQREWWVLSDAGSFGRVAAANTATTSAGLIAAQRGAPLSSATTGDGSTFIPPVPVSASETYASGYSGSGLGPPVYMYSGELPSGSALNFGLVGVYVTVVLAIGRFLRMYVMGTSKNIMWDDLQDALPVLNMCRDLYTARLHRQLKLEQQLYVELINLLRSPETLLLRTGEFIHYFPRDDESDSSSSSSSSSSSDGSSCDSDSDSNSNSNSNSPSGSPHASDSDGDGGGVSDSNQSPRSRSRRNNRDSRTNLLRAASS